MKSMTIPWTGISACLGTWRKRSILRNTNTSRNCKWWKRRSVWYLCGDLMLKGSVQIHFPGNMHQHELVATCKPIGRKGWKGENKALRLQYHMFACSVCPDSWCMFSSTRITAILTKNLELVLKNKSGVQTFSTWVIQSQLVIRMN